MRTENRTKTPAKWLAVACLLLLLLGVVVWFVRRPKSAAVAHPERIAIAETMAQLSRTIEHLFVEGRRSRQIGSGRSGRRADWQEADRMLAIDDGWVQEVDKRAHRIKLLSSLSDS